MSVNMKCGGYKLKLFEKGVSEFRFCSLKERTCATISKESLAAMNEHETENAFINKGLQRLLIF